MRERDLKVCSNCAHWKHIGQVDVGGGGPYDAEALEDMGECRAFPPQINEGLCWRTCRWPTTAHYEWCGQFANKHEE